MSNNQSPISKHCCFLLSAPGSLLSSSSSLFTSAQYCPRASPVMVNTSLHQPSFQPRVGLVTMRKETFDTFDQLVNVETPTLVDFYSHTCGPCVMIASEVAKVATEMKGKLRVAKLDVDKYPKTASRYNIQALPTLKLFKNGKVLTEFVGLMDKDEIIRRVSPYL